MQRCAQPIARNPQRELWQGSIQRQQCVACIEEAGVAQQARMSDRTRVNRQQQMPQPFPIRDEQAAHRLLPEWFIVIKNIDQPITALQQ